MPNQIETNKKVINNAISAYLLLFISSMFLLNKRDQYINNNFVRSHTKVALIIHFLFLLTLIVFSSFWLWEEIQIYNFWLNDIIWTSIFLMLFLSLITWIYRAFLWETFKLWDIKIYSSSSELIDINWDWKISEKDKIKIILNYIPFIWFIDFWKYKNNQLIRKVNKFNLYCSIIIMIFYVIWSYNIANLFVLFYIIFVVYVWINLLNDKVISINLPKIFLSPEEKYYFTKNLKKYLSNYLNDKEFIPLNEIIKSETHKQNEMELKVEKELENKKDIKIKKSLIYIPFLNLIFIFLLNSKYKYHIINGLVITILLIISILLNKFWFIYSSVNLLFLFPIFYGIWYIDSRLAYRMPYIFMFYSLVSNFLSSIKNIFKKTNEIRKKEDKISLKPKNTQE